MFSQFVSRPTYVFFSCKLLVLSASCLQVLNSIDVCIQSAQNFMNGQYFSSFNIFSQSKYPQSCTALQPSGIFPLAEHSPQAHYNDEQTSPNKNSKTTKKSTNRFSSAHLLLLLDTHYSCLNRLLMSLFRKSRCPPITNLLQLQ